VIGVALRDGASKQLGRYGRIMPDEDQTGKQFIEVPADEVAPITARMLSDLPIDDLTIEDPPIEAVIEHAFNEAAPVAE
jgi:ABC-2 type transport system ATP-binding protein